MTGLTIKDLIEKRYVNPNTTWTTTTWDSMPRVIVDPLSKKRISNKKEAKKMLKIKQTDKMTIEEFKNNRKAYDEIRLIINDEKFKKFKEDYGVNPFGMFSYDNGDDYVALKDETIEFKPKAILRVSASKMIPYYFIDEVIGIYYLVCNDE